MLDIASDRSLKISVSIISRLTQEHILKYRTAAISFVLTALSLMQRAGPQQAERRCSERTGILRRKAAVNL